VIKQLIILVFLILNINIFSNSTPITDARILYLIQETKENIIEKIEKSNLKNKDSLLTQLDDIKFSEKNLKEGSTIGMEIYSATKTFSKDDKIYKTEKVWTDKKMIFNPKYYYLNDDEIIYNIKYQFTVFLVYFYLNDPPKTKGDLKTDKTFKYLANIVDFDLDYTPKAKEYKGEKPIENARILNLVQDISTEVKDKINRSNIPNKKMILNELESIRVYEILDDRGDFIEIRMGKMSYGNDTVSKIKWVDKRLAFRKKAYFLQSYILKPAITLKFAEFIYNFEYPNSRSFDENKYNYICDILEVNPKSPYKIPEYPGEKLVVDKRILYHFNLMHQEVVEKVEDSELKNKERLIEELKDILAYRTNKSGKEVAAMVLTKVVYEASSIDGKKTFKTTFIDDKRILFREEAFKLSDKALQNTIKHEFAHALVEFYYSYEPKDDHGKEFKYMCKILGVDPRYSQAIVPMTEDDMLK
jgi:hypothetical protein